MNKALFDKVKDLCKDYGLSEKYLQATTEAMGGHVADDSTDTEEIEKVANQVASVAKASQAEATRWAAKKEKTPAKKKNPEDEEDEDEDEDGKKKKSKAKKSEDEEDPYEARIKALEEKLAKAEEEKSKTSRKAEIEKAMETHKIPQYLRARFAKSIDDEEDVEEAVKAYKQELITNGLDKDESGGAKTVSEKDLEDASEDLLKSISTNQEKK